MSQTTSGADEYPRLNALTETERYRLLADERRRRTLDVLSNYTPPMELSELAAEVVARGETPEGERRARVEVSLHHHHLPLMDELGVVDYDPDSNRIRRSGSF